MKPASQGELSILADRFRLLGDITRLSVLLALIEGPVSVGDIAARIGASDSLVSHHLRLLRGARLVASERRARHIFYRLDDEHVRHMLIDMLEHGREDAGKPTAADPT